MKKRKLGAYSPTVGGQADSQAYVAARKAHEASTVAILLRSHEGVRESDTIDHTRDNVSSTS